MVCRTLDACDDTCDVYDLCEVVVKGGCDVVEGRIICEGFKFTSKLDSEVKTNSACYEGYGYQLSNIQYEWEITNPCDKDWFDRRFVTQLCDKYSMEITGYVQKDCGDFVPKETLTACIIEETGREYGKGVTRSIKGKALHRKLWDNHQDNQGNVSNASKSHKNNVANSSGRWQDAVPTLGIPYDLLFSDEYENLRRGFISSASTVVTNHPLYQLANTNWNTAGRDLTNWINTNLTV